MGATAHRYTLWKLFVHFFGCLVLLLLCVMTGCAHVDMDPLYQGPQPLPPELEKRFVRSKGPRTTLSEVLIQHGPGYTVNRIKINRTLGQPICLDYYRPQRHGRPLPVVLVLPILGGNNKFAKNFADYFARHNYAAIIVQRNREFRIMVNLERIDQILEGIVKDHCRVIDWIQTRPGLDAGRIGVMGISLGAIKTSLITSLDQRVKAGVMMLVGGDLPYIFTYSHERRVQEKRRAYMEKHSLDLPGFHRRMKADISVDPLAFAPYTDASRVLMVLALFDRSIPFSSGRKLRRRMGRPETIYLFSGHYSAALYLPYVRCQALKFFQKKLKP